MLLANYPNDPKFDNGKFWSPAKWNQQIIPSGYKMKWHQVGNGCVQLRLPVAILNNAYICQGYVKRDEKTEKRMLAKFNLFINVSGILHPERVAFGWRWIAHICI